NRSLISSVMNATDYTDFNPMGTYTAVLQLGYENENGGTWLNFLYGDQDGKLDEDEGLANGETSAGTTFQVDLSTGYNATEALYLGLNASYLTTAAGERYHGSAIVDANNDATGFYGIARKLQASASDQCEVGGRLEYFCISNDRGSAIATNPSSGPDYALAFPLSANIRRTSTLTLISELRLETSSEGSSSI